MAMAEAANLAVQCGTPMNASRVILLQTRSSNIKGNRFKTPGSGVFACEDFHLVDLKEGKFYPSCLPPMVSIVEPYSADLVCAESSVFLIGGINRHHFASKYSNHKKEHDNCPEYYLGAACLDLESVLLRRGNTTVLNTTALEYNNLEWEQIEVPRNNVWSPRCTSLNGLLYNFGDSLPLSYTCHQPVMELNARSLITPEVFDPAKPNLGWRKMSKSPLLPELVGCKVSVPIITCPDRHCIFMRVYGGETSIQPSLYVYRPGGVNGPEWECLDPCFPTWSRSAIVVNGVIYFHRAYHLFTKDNELRSELRSEPILAYDTVLKSWLNVNVPGWPEMMYGLGIQHNSRPFRGYLLSVGNGIICLGSCFVDGDDTSGKLVLFEFSVSKKFETAIFHLTSCNIYTVEGAAGSRLMIVV